MDTVCNAGFFGQELDIPETEKEWVRLVLWEMQMVRGSEFFILRVLL